MSFPKHLLRFIYHLIFTLRPTTDCPSKKVDEIERNDNKQAKHYQFEHLFGFEIEKFIDEPRLYILVATKCRFRDEIDKVE